MMRAEEVRHPGVVTEMEGETIRVKVLQVSACASCHAKGACSLADMEEKIVEVEGFHGRLLHPGDHVTLAMRRTSGNRAVLLGYFLPFLLLMATMITGSFFIQSEGLLALVSIGVLIPYYLLLYHFRERLKKKFLITIAD